MCPLHAHGAHDGHDVPTARSRWSRYAPCSLTKVTMVAVCSAGGHKENFEVGRCAYLLLLAAEASPNRGGVCGYACPFPQHTLSLFATRGAPLFAQEFISPMIAEGIGRAKALSAIDTGATVCTTTCAHRLYLLVLLLAPIALRYLLSLHTRGCSSAQCLM